MTLDDLILHPSTRDQLQRFVARPSHSLLLTAQKGMGKMAIALALVEELLGKAPESHPYHLHINYQSVDPEKPSIPIEAIRELQKFLQLKTLGKNRIRRTVVIEDAHKMTHEAQNAFLKLLEEPPADTLIVLTADSPRSLLPTILSRAQHIAVNVPDESTVRERNFSQDSQDVDQVYRLSGGLPGLMHALLTDSEHPFAVSVKLAKGVLQKTPYERLILVDVLAKDKSKALGLTEALERIAQAGLSGAAAKQDASRIKQWHKVRKASLEAQNALRSSANAKLTLSSMFLNL